MSNYLPPCFSVCPLMYDKEDPPKCCTKICEPKPKTQEQLDLEREKRLHLQSLLNEVAFKDICRPGIQCEDECEEYTLIRY